jgi:hypothetical protein
VHEVRNDRDFYALDEPAVSNLRSIEIPVQQPAPGPSHGRTEGPKKRIQTREPDESDDEILSVASMDSNNLLINVRDSAVPDYLIDLI